MKILTLLKKNVRMKISASLKKCENKNLGLIQENVRKKNLGLIQKYVRMKILASFKKCENENLGLIQNNVRMKNLIQKEN